MKLSAFFLTLILICFNVQSHAQKLLRLNDGIIDLLEDESEKENPYEQNLAIFKLANPEKTSRGLTLISLDNFGTLKQIPYAKFTDYDLAIKYIKDKEWGKAMFKINDGLAINPNLKELLRLAAIVSTMTKDFYMANYYYGRYMELDPDNVKYMVSWAGILMRTFRFAEAKRLLDRAENIVPNYLPTKFYRLILQIMESDTTPDNQAFLSLFLLEKQNVLKWISADRDVYEGFLGPKGFAHMCDLMIGPGSVNKIDEISKALEEYQAAKAEKNADLMKMLNNLSNLNIDGLAIPMEKAIIMFNLGEKEEPLKIMENLISTYPSEALLDFNYGYMLIQTKMYSKAEMILRKSLALMDQDKTRFAIAITLILQNEDKEAWAILKEMAKTKPQEFAGFLDSDIPGMDVIKSDARYPSLCNIAGIPPENQ